MDKVYLVYKTDAHHSYASRDIIGIATTKGTACVLCHQQAKKEGGVINKTESWNLEHLSQTQGYSGEGEFQYEEVRTNVLL